MNATEVEQKLADDEEIGFGAPELSAEALKRGFYPAMVSSIKAAPPSEKYPDKPQLEIEFTFDPSLLKYPVKRWCGRSFGKSATGYSFLAKLIQHTTGIPCGDKRQRSVKVSEIVGNTVEVRTDVNDRGYTSVEEVTGSGF